ncbi:AraC family ligand binding domain-containing protein [Metabacillus sp. RGM 3146]|uniref:AraC family transcriptional regulator n=1 Tax=Metabacillus sp. RGM 3146 TaxID=3401092 RepID=UPI003B995EF2
MTDYIDFHTNQELDKHCFYMRHREGDHQHKWKLHSHNGFEIFYFFKGVANYIIGEGIYQLTPGDMLIFNGKILHQVNPSDKETYVRTFINFFPSLLDNSLPEDILKKIIGMFNSPCGQLIHWEGKEREEIERLMNEMVREYEKEAVGYLQLTEAYLMQLLIKIYRKSKEAIYSSREIQYSQKERHVRHILNFINNHFRENLNLDQIANVLHVNKHYICHCFKEVTGFTINKYLANRRIEEAKNLLVTSNDSIGMIFGGAGL